MTTTARALVGIAKSEVTYEVQWSGGAGPVQLYHILHIPKSTHKLVSFAGSGDNGDTVQLAKSSRVIRLQRNIVSVHRGTDGTDAGKFKKVGEQKALAAPAKSISFPDVWPARPAHANCCAVRWMADKDIV